MKSTDVQKSSLSPLFRWASAVRGSPKTRAPDFIPPDRATETPAGSRSSRHHLVRVGKLPERRLGTRGLDQREDVAEEGVEDGRGVCDVEVEGGEGEAEVELGVVVERGAVVGGQALGERPGEDVAEGDEVEVQVERDGVVEAEVFVGNSRPVSCRYNSMSYGV